MKYLKALLLLLALGAGVWAVTVPTQEGIFLKTPGTQSIAPCPGNVSYNLPLYFVANRGQYNSKARYYTVTNRYTMWLTAEGLVFDRKKKTGQKTQRDVSRMLFLDANREPEMIALDKTPLRLNFFKGNDSSKWHGNVPAWGAVLYKNLYPGIRLKLYGLEKELEYDWIVEPGGEPGRIRFQYENIESCRIDDEGNLAVETGLGELRHRKPFAYQETPEGLRSEIKVKFRKIKENTYGFEVGKYDKTKTLIIDPVIFTYSTYLGGDYEDAAFGVEALGNGRVMVAGVTASRNFPVLNLLKENKEDYDEDVFVAIIDTNRRGAESLVYSVIVGGAGNEGGYGLKTDGRGNAYVTGRTYSSDFPTVNAYQPEKNYSRDAFLFKLDTTLTGADSLVYSTYFGGSETDTGDSVAVDKNGSVYITGSTSSSDFPTRNAYQSALKGTQNAFIAKFDTTLDGDASLLYSTYMGGTRWETSHSIAVAPDIPDIVYITGLTDSTDYPVRNSYMTDPGDETQDIYISKLDTSVSGTDGLLYSTYFGGKRRDVGYGIDVDNAGKVYVTGYVESPDFPTKNPIQSGLNGDIYYDVFFLMMDTTERGDDSLLMSTYMGGAYYDTGLAIKAGDTGNVYITGHTWSFGFPRLFSDKTDDVLPPHQRPQAFFVLIDPYRVGSDCLLEYKTFGGSQHDDVGNRIAVDDEGYVYIAGTTRGPDFPTLNGYQESVGDQSQDAFLTRLAICPVMPIVYLNRTHLNFGALEGGSASAPQYITVTNAGKCFLAWNVEASESWIKATRGEQTENDNLSVSIDTAGLSAGTYTGTVTVYGNDSSVVNPKTIDIHLEIIPASMEQPAFGSFDSPCECRVHSGSIPVTGWALDDIGVSDVKIYRDPMLPGETGRIYIGDAVLVEGARPDVEQMFSQYPNAYKAGWGYMMLSNYLPNGGNGTFNISAVATDLTGTEVSLGTKTITVDNANAVDPFGTIDTPAQGGIASGQYFVNYGWVLTPLPNTIPKDGSTIKVWIDGVALPGNPVYDNYRKDIDTLFPNYNNSSGAVGYYYIDTRDYSNGVHSISWSVKDNAGNTEGIGSRFFVVSNQSLRRPSRGALRGASGGQGAAPPGPPITLRVGGGQLWQYDSQHRNEATIGDTGDVGIVKGYDEEAETEQLRPNDDGVFVVEIDPLERIEVKLSIGDNWGNRYSGYQQVGMIKRPFPAGSYLDRKNGIFYWQPVAGFSGEYRFVFTKNENNLLKQKRLYIRIRSN